MGTRIKERFVMTQIDSHKRPPKPSLQSRLSDGPYPKK